MLFIRGNYRMFRLSSGVWQDLFLDQYKPGEFTENVGIRKVGARKCSEDSDVTEKLSTLCSVNIINQFKCQIKC